MGLTLIQDGSLGFDHFTTDTEAIYTKTGPDNWAVNAGASLLEKAAVASGYHGIRRADITQAKCATARVAETTSWDYNSPIGVGGSGVDDLNYNRPNGYDVQNQYSSTQIKLLKTANGVETVLASGVTPTRTRGIFYLWRIYIHNGTVYLRHGTTALGAVLLSAADAAFSQGHIFAWAGAATLAQWDWVDPRSSHLITCSGLPAGAYLRVSDGTTAAEAQEVGGTATVDASAVLFPIATASVYTDAGGTGTLLGQVTSASAPNMGGGATFTYTPDSTDLVIVPGLVLMGMSAIQGAYVDSETELSSDSLASLSTGTVAATIELETVVLTLEPALAGMSMGAVAVGVVGEAIPEIVIAPALTSMSMGASTPSIVGEPFAELDVSVPYASMSVGTVAATLALLGTLTLEPGPAGISTGTVAVAVSLAVVVAPGSVRTVPAALRIRVVRKSARVLSTPPSRRILLRNPRGLPL